MAALRIEVTHGVTTGRTLLTALPSRASSWRLPLGHSLRQLRVTPATSAGRYNVHVEMTDGNVWENAFTDVTDDGMIQLVEAVKAANAELQHAIATHKPSSAHIDRTF